jgi:cobalt/nickel transport system permease protein
MHIPDAYLSPITQAAGYVVVAPILVYAARKTRASLNTKQAPLLAVGAAFAFAVQMFNIPALGGTTAHALGTALLAILLGPWAAMITMALNLTVQALFFGDGGVLSLGVNAFDMAVVPAFLGAGLYRLIVGSSAGTAGVSTRMLVGAVVASYVGTSVASLCAGVILGIQPLLAHDAMGHALYFPFGLAVSVPAMLMTHLLIAAPAEAIITVSALAYLWKNFPDLAGARTVVRVGSGMRLGRSLIVVLFLTPFGLIAGGTAWGEWDPDALQKLIGYVPKGAAASQDLVKPLLPDYGLPHSSGPVWMVVGYLLSAVLGGGLVALFTHGLIRKSSKPSISSSGRAALGSSLPTWLTTPQDSAVASLEKSSKKPWLEGLLAKMKVSLERALLSEECARKPGFLQGLDARVKFGLALAALVGVALTKQAWVLTLGLGLILGLAWTSWVPIRAFSTRVWGTVFFFGTFAALPLALRAVTPGPIWLALGPFSVSNTGALAAITMLLRLACGIGTMLLLTQTTRWHSLVKGLRSLGLPDGICGALTLAYRYLFVTVATLEEMVIARKSRQVRNAPVGSFAKAQARDYAGAGAAILFGKSYSLMEEVHMAMRSRRYGQPTSVQLQEAQLKAEKLDMKSRVPEKILVTEKLGEINAV